MGDDFADFTRPDHPMNFSEAYPHNIIGFSGKQYDIL
jgi:hypothetical protein